ncbi:hypothetical protein TD95_003460 [Thielaviopsis punctulata]|uniref:Translation initiation factor eIF4E3 n=1 Tax=Thielaviopsis punctulata TaxID=72032 RepID=A0A0F4ZI73_9PEZI|nr:hypothetical protein TD95_003460 [Thielaviopsis punctulata]
MDNIWTRRATKLSLTSSNPGPSSTTSSQSGDTATRNTTTFSKRFGSDTSSTAGVTKANPFAPPSASAVASPTAPSNAFGLGSGAFASFGALAKAGEKAKESAPGTGSGSSSADAGAGAGPAAKCTQAMSTISEAGAGPGSAAAPGAPLNQHPLKNKWVFWFRPPTSKAQGFVDYEKTLHPMAHCSSIEEFFLVYSHLKRVSTLPQVSEYHFFKWGIRPIWEDEVNKQGGKWVVRLKKGVADRYWEDLLFALIGDQFGDAGEEVCGAVVSVRTGEDIISIWTRTDGGRVLRIRETMKHILNFPSNTRVEFKSHDSSIQQRTAIEEQRREKAAQNASGQHHHNHHHHHHHKNNNNNNNGNHNSSGAGGSSLLGMGSGRSHHADQKS